MRYIFLFSLVFTFLLTGCYTQFASREQILPDEEIRMVIDSTGDTVKVIQRTDTIISKERETCIWERDIFGRPVLRCYDSYYPRDWFFYNYSPWWFRNDPSWYDYEQCPRYYRYDPSCDCCRYLYRKNDRSFYDNQKRPGRPDNSSGTSNPSNSSGTPGNTPSSDNQNNVKGRTTGTKEPIPTTQSVHQDGISKIVTDTTDTLTQQEQKQATPPDSTDSLAVKKRDLRSRRSR